MGGGRGRPKELYVIGAAEHTYCTSVAATCTNAQTRVVTGSLRLVLCVRADPDIETVGQLHRWLQGPFYETLYTDTAYDGSLNMHRPGFIHGVSKVHQQCSAYAQPPFCGSLPEWALCVQIIGGVRIGQLRVKERACNEYSPSFVSELGLQNPSLGFKCYGDSSGGYVPTLRPVACAEVDEESCAGTQATWSRWTRSGSFPRWQKRA